MASITNSNDPTEWLSYMMQQNGETPYCCFNRPFAGDERTPCAMEMSFSPDLVFWGRNRESLAPRAAHWDGMKLGIGAPPLRIDEGWLIIYHGVVDSCCGSIYSMSAAILDYREPWKVLARTNKPVLFPRLHQGGEHQVRSAVDNGIERTV